MFAPYQRWDWCFREIGGLVEQLHLVSRRGLTVVMFDSEYVTHQYYRAEEAVRAFENARPGGRTELAPALRSQIALYHARCWVSGKHLSF